MQSTRGGFWSAHSSVGILNRCGRICSEIGADFDMLKTIPNRCDSIFSEDEAKSSEKDQYVEQQYRIK